MVQLQLGIMEALPFRRDTLPLNFHYAHEDTA